MNKFGIIWVFIVCFFQMKAAVVKSARRALYPALVSATEVLRYSGVKHPAIRAHEILYQEITTCPFCRSEGDCYSNIIEDRKQHLAYDPSMCHCIDLSKFCVGPDKIHDVLSRVILDLLPQQLLFISFRRHPEIIYAVQGSGDIFPYRIEGGQAVINIAFCCKRDYETPMHLPSVVNVSISKDGVLTKINAVRRK